MDDRLVFLDDSACLRIADSWLLFLPNRTDPDILLLSLFADLYLRLVKYIGDMWLLQGIEIWFLGVEIRLLIVQVELCVVASVQLLSCFPGFILLSGLLHQLVVPFVDLELSIRLTFANVDDKSHDVDCHSQEG